MLTPYTIPILIGFVALELFFIWSFLTDEKWLRKVIYNER